MAPTGPSPPNTVTFHTGAKADAVWTVSAPGTNANLVLNGPDQNLDLSSSLTETTDLDLSILLSPPGPSSPSTPSLSFPIGIKAMKRRTVNVTVWHIARKKLDTTFEATSVTFTKEEIEDRLNDIYGTQVNTFFNVTIGVNGAWPEEDPRHFQHPVDWDIASDSNFPGVNPDSNPENYALNAPNLSFDVSTPSSPEQEAVVSAKEDTSADINIYIIGGGRSTTFFSSWSVEAGKLAPSNSLATLGIADPPARKAWVDAAPLWGNETAEQIEEFKNQRLQTLAHEIGHAMIGGGHPNQNLGPAPLPGTPHQQRLMFSHYAKGERRLLVKGEWDKIETWLKARALGQN